MLINFNSEFNLNSTQPAFTRIVFIIILWFSVIAFLYIIIIIIGVGAPVGVSFPLYVLHCAG